MIDFVEQVAATRGFGKFFSTSAPIHISRAPGRLDLMGGNVDYTGGLVFESTIREATWAAAQSRTDDRIVVLNPQMVQAGWEPLINVPLAAVRDVSETKSLVNGSASIRWTAYVLGVFHLLQSRWPAQACHGLNLYLASDVPLNKGVSSSAAVEVATMKAAAAAYGIGLSGIELATACQWVENSIADSACGIMDQAASVLGDENAILPILCQPCELREVVRLPPELKLWAIDSGVKHAVSGVEYEAARAAGFIGYQMICDWEQVPVEPDTACGIPRFTDSRWKGYLSNLSPSLFRSRFEARLPESIRGDGLLRSGYAHPDPFTPIRPEVNYPVRGCTRYAVEEQQRIELFVELLQGLNGRPNNEAHRLLGDLMFQSHWSYTECGLGCEETDRLIGFVREELDGARGSGALYGAKITGGGAGGTVVVLGSHDARSRFERVVDRYTDWRKAVPYVFEGSSPGADRFGIHTLEADA